MTSNLPRTKILYHFTTAHSVAAVRQEGITQGALPWHRCRETGEPLLLRNWEERNMTAADIRALRSSERWLAHKARKGNIDAAQNWVRLFPGFQWLTTNPDFAQTWCLLGDLPFAKNAFRITVLVPESAYPRLISWPELCDRHAPPSAAELNVPQVDWKNWYVFNGWIPPTAFLEVHRNPGEQLAANPLLSQ